VSNTRVLTVPQMGFIPYRLYIVLYLRIALKIQNMQNSNTTVVKISKIQYWIRHKWSIKQTCIVQSSQNK